MVLGYVCLYSQFSGQPIKSSWVKTNEEITASIRGKNEIEILKVTKLTN